MLKGKEKACGAKVSISWGRLVLQSRLQDFDVHIRLFLNAPFETIICCNERTACTKCLSFTVMQFYVVLLGDWVNGPDSSPQSICVPHPVLKWDNVLHSLRQVAWMTSLPYPLNVSITGIKRADNWAAKQSKCCDCDPSSLEMHLWKHVLIETHLRGS